MLEMMTSYVAVYDDTESDAALPATRRLVEIHRALGVAATFGIVTEKLESDRALARAYHELLCDGIEDGLFEVVPHSHTHATFFDHDTLGEGIALEQAQEEIRRSKRLVEEIFEKSVLGFRSPNGYFGGWARQPQLLQTLGEEGFSFLSSFLMGPGDTVPAPLTQPFYYSEAGYPNPASL